jgi:hypothetical protein
LVNVVAHPVSNNTGRTGKIFFHIMEAGLHKGRWFVKLDLTLESPSFYRIFLTPA